MNRCFESIYCAMAICEVLVIQIVRVGSPGIPRTNGYAIVTWTISPRTLSVLVALEVMHGVTVLAGVELEYCTQTSAAVTLSPGKFRLATKFFTSFTFAVQPEVLYPEPSEPVPSQEKPQLPPRTIA